MVKRSNSYNPDARGGGWGWAGVAVGVLAFDVLAPETMSNYARRCIESDNPVVRALPPLIGGVLLSHCLDITPERVDPIDGLSRSLDKMCEKIGEWTVTGVHIP